MRQPPRAGFAGGVRTLLLAAPRRGRGPAGDVKISAGRSAGPVGRQRLFRLSDLGEGLTEAEVLEWKVAVGEVVEVDQIVAEVETAKAVVEVPVPYAGRVLVLHCEPGTVLDVGAPLISVAAAEDAVETADGAGERGFPRYVADWVERPSVLLADP